jgi:xanthine dehydrogenase YagS FAD-binding subunit
MRPFTHYNARTVEEACTLLKRYNGKAVLNAGGTDLVPTLKAEHLLCHPEAIINIKTITDLAYIREDGDVLRIGALTTLSDIARSPLLRKRYRSLAEAAQSVATPQVRNMATLGGNLCQDIRCWYYRYPRHIGGPIECLRKGNGPCLAVTGDNRYHAIMGARGCLAVCPSDTAVALAALNGRITIVGTRGGRSVAVTDFFHPLGNALKRGEMVQEIEVPKITAAARQMFLKFTLRRPIDFAIVSVASVIAAPAPRGRCREARIALGAVGPAPVRATAAEAWLKGKPIDEQTAAEAAAAAMAGARSLRMNAYKVEIAKILIKRALLS